MNPDGSSYTKLHDFNSTDGANPKARLFELSGVLYGTTRLGGSYSNGVIFSINPDGTSYSKIHDFTSSQGAYPEAELIEYNSKLFGTTLQGGTYSLGVAYTIYPDGSSFSKLWDFKPETSLGKNSYASLLEYNLSLIHI